MNEQLFLSALLHKYQDAINKNKEYDEWEVANPDKRYWEYKGKVVPKAEIKRLGIMIRQTMIDYEKHL